MIEPEQKSSSSSGAIKAMIWTSISIGISGAVIQFLGIQQILNVVGLGFLNIIHILAVLGVSIFLLIIGGILRNNQSPEPVSYPGVGYMNETRLFRPTEKETSFESIIQETKSKNARVRPASTRTS